MPRQRSDRVPLGLYPRKAKQKAAKVESKIVKRGDAALAAMAAAVVLLRLEELVLPMHFWLVLIALSAVFVVAAAKVAGDK